MALEGLKAAMSSTASAAAERAQANWKNHKVAIVLTGLAVAAGITLAVLGGTGVIHAAGSMLSMSSTVNTIALTAGVAGAAAGAAGLGYNLFGKPLADRVEPYTIDNTDKELKQRLAEQNSIEQHEQNPPAPPEVQEEPAAAQPTEAQLAAEAARVAQQRQAEQQQQERQEEEQTAPQPQAAPQPQTAQVEQQQQARQEEEQAAPQPEAAQTAPKPKKDDDAFQGVKSQVEQQTQAPTPTPAKRSWKAPVLTVAALATAGGIAYASYTGNLPSAQQIQQFGQDLYAGGQNLVARGGAALHSAYESLPTKEQVSATISDTLTQAKNTILRQDPEGTANGICQENRLGTMWSNAPTLSEIGSKLHSLAYAEIGAPVLGGAMSPFAFLTR